VRRFSLYRRGKIFYCQFYNPKTGKYLPGRSTGQTNRDAAILVVYEWEHNGIPDRGGERCRPGSETIDVDTILETIRKTDLTAQDAERIVTALKTCGLVEAAVVKSGPGSEQFTAFLSRFWNYDESPYVREKFAHGHSIGRRHCYDMSIWLKLYWQPFFADKRLSQIKKTDLKRFSLWLAESGNLKPKTINNILAAGTVALRWAKENELIAVNPAEGLMKFSGGSAERGVLTESEARRLFALEWADEHARIGNLLAMTTGLRAGEVLGVQVRDIGIDRLHVRHSWSNQDGLKSPKTGVERMIPLLAIVREALLSLARKNPHGIGPTSFVFWSVTRADRPMDFHFLLDGLKDTLLQLLLTKVELRDTEKVHRAREYWRQRNVVFHSWRHYFATYLRNRLCMPTLQLATGHKRRSMAEHYAAHAQEHDFVEVSRAIEGAFSGVIPFRKINELTVCNS
jgi:integrase